MQSNSSEMHAWFIDQYPYGDRRLPHRSYPVRYLDVRELQRLTNVTYFKVMFVCLIDFIGNDFSGRYG